MGKGLDTCLVVKQMVKSAVAQVDVDIAEKKKKLLSLTSLNVQPQPREDLARQVNADAELGKTREFGWRISSCIKHVKHA